MKKGTTNFKQGDYIATIPFGVCRVRGYKMVYEKGKGATKWYNVKVSKKSKEVFYVQETLIKGPSKKKFFS